MSGHSKWHSIRHKKAREDAKRGKVFTKLIRELTVSARAGGGDPTMNPRLRTAIDRAKAENMPADNIERAIKKGTGELEGVRYEEYTYEGYGPGGTAILVEVMTDNKNRCTAEVRHIFSKQNGNLGENGCVAWIFEKKGYLAVPAEGVDEETLMDIALEAGADDIVEDAEDKQFEVYTELEAFQAVKEALDAKGVAYQAADITMIPKNTVKLQGKEAEQTLRLMDALEDNDDVQNVYSNFDISKEVMESLTSG
jgi:YebC/PmpR family DNA-binding regulatory protein